MKEPTIEFRHSGTNDLLLGVTLERWGMPVPEVGQWIRLENLWVQVSEKRYIFRESKQAEQLSQRILVLLVT